MNSLLWGAVPVLKYHHVNRRKPDAVTVSPEIFEKQIITLKELGYRTVFLDEFERCLYEDRFFGEKLVAITFDDGYSDNYRYAFPILKKYGVKATIFITTSDIGRKKAGFLTWPQLKEMQNSGLVDIQSHAHYHRQPSLVTRADDSVAAYKRRIRKEIGMSKKLIERKLGKKVLYVAWPWGRFNRETVRVAKELGFRMCLTTLYGSNHVLTGRSRIKRFTPESNIERFREQMLRNSYLIPSLCIDDKLYNLFCRRFIRRKLAEAYSWRR